MNKRESERDWLQIFKQAKALNEEYSKSEKLANDYSIRELTDIQRRQISSMS